MTERDGGPASELTLLDAAALYLTGVLFSRGDVDVQQEADWALRRGRELAEGWMEERRIAAREETGR